MNPQGILKKELRFDSFYRNKTNYDHNSINSEVETFKSKPKKKKVTFKESRSMAHKQ